MLRLRNQATEQEEQKKRENNNARKECIKIQGLQLNINKSKIYIGDVTTTAFLHHGKTIQKLLLSLLLLLPLLLI